MREGTPIGIRYEDLHGRQGVTYRGERGQVIRHLYDSLSSLEHIVLGFGDREVALSGCFEGEEFMEVEAHLSD